MYKDRFTCEKKQSRTNDIVKEFILSYFLSIYIIIHLPYNAFRFWFLHIPFLSRIYKIVKLKKKKIFEKNILYICRFPPDFSSNISSCFKLKLLFSALESDLSIVSFNLSRTANIIIFSLVSFITNMNLFANVSQRTKATKKITAVRKRKTRVMMI